MKTLLALGTLLLVGSSLGCATEMEEGGEGQDVSASSAALLELCTMETNSNACKSQVSYIEVTGGISKVAQKRINDVLRTEQLPECDPSAKVDGVTHTQARQINEMGILSVLVSHGRSSTSLRTRVFKLEALTFDLKTGARLATQDIFTTKGQARLSEECSKVYFWDSPEKAACNDPGPNILFKKEGAVGSHMDLVGRPLNRDQALDGPVLTSFSQFDNDMIKHEGVRKLLAKVPSREPLPPYYQ